MTDKYFFLLQYKQEISNRILAIYVFLRFYFTVRWKILNNKLTKQDFLRGVISGNFASKLIYKLIKMKIHRFVPILLTACILYACSKKEGDSDASQHSVYICQPKTQDGSASLSFPGVVKENDNISLGFKAAGEIKSIFVKEGSTSKQASSLPNWTTPTTNLLSTPCRYSMTRLVRKRNAHAACLRTKVCRKTTTTRRSPD